MTQQQFPLDFQWQTQEPFLFCVHHYDFFPKGNGKFGPEEHHLKNRAMGQDFRVKDGFRMYHGQVVPGFPVHPHRGFETITIVRKGYVDHSDSMGAAGRYGEGDVQWMTAGAGVQHSEMFPLIRQDQGNTLELFQIWLNLPKKSKMTKPHFTMFWNDKIPVLNLENDQVRLSLIAGEYQGVKAEAPPPASWASDPTSEVAIWLVKMKKDSKFSIPPTKEPISRSLYFFEGSDMTVDGKKVGSKTGIHLESTEDTKLVATSTDVEFLLLQAKPIGEPVVQHGPFVMNTREEIVQTIHDYQDTQFGGWPWPQAEMVHGEKLERFARYPDGKVEKPQK